MITPDRVTKGDMIYNARPGNKIYDVCDLVAEEGYAGFVFNGAVVMREFKPGDSDEKESAEDLRRKYYRLRGTT